MAAAAEIPYFARRYALRCSECHVAPPKLNARGEEFVALGYRLPDLVEPRRTLPLAVWVSARGEALATDDERGLLNRVELISGGRLTSWLAYFVEWRPVSFESRANGPLRDRSGRFEDLFVTASRASIEGTAGQFRLMQQVDVSRRLGLSEPLLLASGLSGIGSGTPREVGLRGFSPSGRSPAARVAWVAQRGGWRWSTSLALPLPGELSLPLTDDARLEASNELELDPKGVFIETFARRGLLSAGAHAFYDNGDRYLLGALTTGAHGPLHWALGVGTARAGNVSRTRWSIEAELIPHTAFAGGVRLEDQVDNVPQALVTYVNTHFPGTRYTVRVTLEHRIQRDRPAWLLEAGAVF